jgi:hypothetical protein
VVENEWQCMLEVSVSEVSWPKGMKVLENWRNVWCEKKNSWGTENK